MLVYRLPGPMITRSASRSAATAAGWAWGFGGDSEREVIRPDARATLLSPVRVSPASVEAMRVTSVVVEGITRPRMARSSPAISTALEKSPPMPARAAMSMLPKL